MSLTILDALINLPNQATEFRTDLLDQQTGFVTLVTDVSAALPPHEDFDFNGNVLESLPRADFIQKYGDVKLNELTDFRVKNIKLMWSHDPINASEPGAIFQPLLVVRIQEVLDEHEIIHFTPLRNHYGSSLTTLTWAKPKK